jgi:hypothetical protein
LTTQVYYVPHVQVNSSHPHEDSELACIF